MQEFEGIEELGGSEQANSYQTGVALLLVLWIFMVLTVMAGEFARAMRDDAIATSNSAEETQAYGVAMAGVNIGIYKVLREREYAEWASFGAPSQTDEDEEDEEENPDALSQRNWVPDGRWYDGEYWGGNYHVRMTDEGGKIGLNAADEALLRQVFNNLGLDEDEQETITDSILDWRDSDSLHRTNGAEASYYLDLPNPYLPKDGLFDAVDELLLVRGVSRELYFGNEDEEERQVPLKNIFSVFNLTGTVNVRTASREVLEALLGLEEEELDEIVDLRDSDPRGVLLRLRASIGDPLLSRRLVDRRVSTISVESEARMVDGRMAARVAAVVDLAEDADGFHLRRWVDRAPAFENETESGGSGA